MVHVKPKGSYSVASATGPRQSDSYFWFLHLSQVFSNVSWQNTFVAFLVRHRCLSWHFVQRLRAHLLVAHSAKQTVVYISASYWCSEGEAQAQKLNCCKSCVRAKCLVASDYSFIHFMKTLINGCSYSMRLQLPVITATILPYCYFHVFTWTGYLISINRQWPV